MRAWNEFVARIGDVVPVPLLGLVLFATAVLTALLWYWWPEWFQALRRMRWPRWRRSGRRWFRKRRLRWRRKRKRQQRAQEPATALDAQDVAPDELPDVPAGVLTLNADELAAQGRYKEAVRERLRAIVRELVELRVVDGRPGWTVTELAAQAGRSRPAAAVPLTAASDVFSAIWYGGRQATAADDLAMRGYAEQVRAALVHGQVPA